MNRFSSVLKYYKFIRQIPIFAGLNWFEARRIASCARLIVVRKGQTIYQAGDPADGLYCLVSGRVQAYGLTRHQERCDVEFFRRGMFFGVISLLTGEPHSMTFEAVNDSRILFIPKDDFVGILKRSPYLGVEFSRSLSRRLQERSLRERKKSLSKILSVYSPVRQTGNSTYAFHLAYQIAAQNGSHVLLMKIASALPGDGGGEAFDLSQAAPQWKDSDKRHLDEMMQDDEKVRSLIVSTECGLDLLQASFFPDDGRLVSQISDFVTARAADYDYVVVDLPNDQDEVVLKTLVQSDEVYLLAHDDQRELSLIRQVLDHLQDELRGHFQPDNVHVVMKTLETLEPLAQSVIRDMLDFDVYERLPFLQNADLGESRDLGALWVRFPRSRCLFEQSLIKAAREVSGIRIGLALGGGAALGIAHIGVLRVLEREGIPVDMVAGSSMGALIASLWATRYDARSLEEISGQFRDQRAMLKLFDPVVPISGILGGRLIKRWLYRFLGNTSFFETRLPVKIVAYDLNNRQELVYDKGLLIEAVRKSISIPGVFEPVVEQDRIIIDGGVLNPVPTNVLSREGIDRIIAVNVLQSPDEVLKGLQTRKSLMEKQHSLSFLRSPMTFLKTRFVERRLERPHPTISDIMVQTLLASEYHMSQQSMRDANVVIHPDLSGIQWYELYRVEELIRRGEQAAEEALPAIRELVAKR